MGKKARNAGKKSSKTCDKPATAKSSHCKGTKAKWLNKAIRIMNDTVLYNDYEDAVEKVDEINEKLWPVFAKPILNSV